MKQISGFETVFFRLVMAMCILCMILGLSACYSSKTATRQVIKAHTYHPEVVASICGSMYPPLELMRDSIVYREGQLQYRYDTITVDCDSLMNATAKGAPSVFRLPCPPCPQRTDTIYHDRYRQVENKARVQELEIKNENLNQDKIKDSVRLRITLWWAGIATALLLCCILLRIFKIL